MRAGTLRHRITIQQRAADKQDPDTGAMIEGWSDLATVWANVEPLSVREFIASRGEQAEITARITIRYREGLDAAMRIQHRGLIYNIEGVLPDNRTGRQYLTLPVSGGINDG